MRGCQTLGDYVQQIINNDELSSILGSVMAFTSKPIELVTGSV
jgi:hypothetical protein